MVFLADFAFAKRWEHNRSRFEAAERRVRLVPASASGQVAFGAYSWDPDKGAYRPMALQVPTRQGLDFQVVYPTALMMCPLETFAAVAPSMDPEECLAVLHEIEDEDARSGAYAAFDGAAELLTAMRPGDWGLVTSNYEHRVRVRFSRTGLPLPQVIVDAAAVTRGKPHPEAYLIAARALGRAPEDCLVIEDGRAGIKGSRDGGLGGERGLGGCRSPRCGPHYRRLDVAVADVLDWVSAD